MFTIGSSLGCKCSGTYAVAFCRQADGVAEFLNWLNQLAVTSTL